MSFLLGAALLTMLPLMSLAQTPGVGIGTTTPTQTLDVNGSLRVRGLTGPGNRLPVVLPDGTLGMNPPVYGTPVSVPSFPGAATGAVNTSYQPFRVAVSGTTVYVVSQDNSVLQTFDVANSAGPLLLGTVVMGGNATSVAVSGTKAYVVNQSNTLRVVDAGTPTAPVLRGSVGTDSNPFSVAVSGTKAYVVNSGSNTLQVFDVATPTAPVLLGSVGTDSAPISVAVSGTKAYVVNDGSSTLQVFDVATPGAPVLLGSVGTDNSPYSVTVSGTTAYVVSPGSNTLQVFDVTVPTAPVLVGAVGTGSDPTGVAVSGTTAYVVNSGSNTLQVFDVTTPTAPVLLGSVGTDNVPISVAVSGTTAYVVNIVSNTLQVFDFPSPPRVVAVNPDGSLGSVTLPSGADFIHNGTAQQANANFNISGTGTVGGRVGIGTTAPNSRLSISPGNTEPKITLWDGGSTTNHYGFGISGSQLNYHINTAGANHVFYAGGKNGDGTELLRIQGNGNVGIGTPTPGQRLEVVGNLKLSGNGNGLLFPDNSLQTTAALATASNGLTKTGNDVTLGGTLTANTDVPLNAKTLTFSGTGSVGIGTTAPDVSAALDIVSSTKGALLPRVASATAVVTPATGLLVFQTGAPAGFYYNAGTSGTPNWQQIATATGAAVTASNGLTKTGADITLGGPLTRATTLAAGSNAFSLTQSLAGPGGVVAVDQNTLSASSVSYLNGTNYQTVTAGVTGTLTQLELKQGYNVGATSNFTLTLRNGAGTGGAVLYSAAVSFVGTGTQTVYSYPITGVSLTAGQVFTIQVAGGATNWSYNATNAYAGGAAGFNAANDFLFRTTMQAATVVTALTASGGNVGIGTPTPAATLHVGGSTSTVRLEGLGNGSSTRLVTVDAGGNLVAAAALPTGTTGDNLGNHTATQNLNLGTSALVGNDGTTGLTIASTGAVTTAGALITGGAIAAGGNVHLGANQLVGNGGTTGLTIASTGAVTTAGALITGGAIAAGGNVHLGANQLVGNGGTTGLTVGSTGNVGIGAAAPNSRLSISPGSSEPKITLWDGGSATNHYGFGISTGQLNYHIDGASSNHVFYAGGKNGNGTELLRIQGNGTVSTSGELRVQIANNRLRRGITPLTTTDAFDTEFGVHIGNGETEEGGFWANGNYAAIYSPGDNDLVKFLDEDGFNSNGTAYDNGALKARIDGNGQYFQVSDAKAKHDITPITDGLRKLTSLSGYTYAFNLLPQEVQKGQKALRAAGVLAQEVGRVLPEAVSQQDGHYMVNYAALTPLFIQAIKEQQAQIEALTARAATAEARAAQADADHASLLTLQAQMARLLGAAAPADSQARR